MTPTDLIKELMIENRELREEVARLKAEAEAKKEAVPASDRDGN